MQINLAWSSHQEDGARTLSSQDRILGTILPFRSDLVTAKDALEQIEQGVFRWKYYGV